MGLRGKMDGEVKVRKEMKGNKNRGKESGEKEKKLIRRGSRMVRGKGRVRVERVRGGVDE